MGKGAATGDRPALELSNETPREELVYRLAMDEHYYTIDPNELKLDGKEREAYLQELVKDGVLERLKYLVSSVEDGQEEGKVEEHWALTTLGAWRKVKSQGELSKADKALLKCLKAYDPVTIYWLKLELEKQAIGGEEVDRTLQELNQRGLIETYQLGKDFKVTLTPMGELIATSSKAPKAGESLYRGYSDGWIDLPHTNLETTQPFEAPDPEASPEQLKKVAELLAEFEAKQALNGWGYSYYLLPEEIKSSKNLDREQAVRILNRLASEGAVSRTVEAGERESKDKLESFREIRYTINQGEAYQEFKARQLSLEGHSLFYVFLQDTDTISEKVLKQKTGVGEREFKEGLEDLKALGIIKPGPTGKFLVITSSGKRFRAFLKKGI